MITHKEMIQEYEEFKCDLIIIKAIPFTGGFRVELYEKDKSEFNLIPTNELIFNKHIFNFSLKLLNSYVFSVDKRDIVIETDEGRFNCKFMIGKHVLEVEQIGE